MNWSAMGSFSLMLVVVAACIAMLLAAMLWLDGRIGSGWAFAITIGFTAICTIVFVGLTTP